MLYSSKNPREQIKGILIVYLAGVLLIYLMLAIQQGFLFVPAFNADFNRSIIFLTILIGVLLYSDDFEVIIAFCLLGPIIVYAVAAVISVFLSDDAFFGFVGTITVAMSYFFIAGMGGLCMSVASGWLGNKFRSVHKNVQIGNGGIFKVISTPIKDQTVPIADLDKLHSPMQMFGIIFIECIILFSSFLLFYLPMYDYNVDSHLYVSDLHFLLVILILSVGLNAILLIGAMFLAFNSPKLLLRYNSNLLKAQSLYNGVGYFFISLFFPNPSFRVDNFQVASGNGIEFLAFILFFSMFMTPSVFEYLKLNRTNIA